MKDFYDCIVIGGGPAGSTVAAIVASAGFSTLQVEREAMPRFHVGESLMPACRRILLRLGALEAVRNHGFVRKCSVEFISGCGRRRQLFDFRDREPGEQGFTWQVDRGQFDKLLFDNSRRLGADCLDRTLVAQVLLDGERAAGVRLESDLGQPVDVQARVVVDASGRKALLARQLGLVSAEKPREKAAIWGYYRGARRDGGELGGGTLVVHSANKQSWFWFVPLADDLASIGVVADREYLLAGRGLPAGVFEDELVNCPGLADRMMTAQLASPFNVAKESAYSATRRAGDGWVLVGEAGGCLDPVCSSGVFLAMQSAELAGESILRALADGDLSAARLGEWITPFDRGAQWLTRLTDAFYRPDFDMANFWRDFPGHRPALLDLLMGNVYGPSAECEFGPLFEDLNSSLAMRSGAAPPLDVVSGQE